MAAQVGIAGSSKIGKNVLIGGQAGISGHLKIADQTKIVAQSGIPSTVKKAQTPSCYNAAASSKKSS